MPSPADSRYHALFEGSPDPIGLIKDGVFIDCNQAMLDMLALKDKADIVGRRAGGTFSPGMQPDGQESSVKAARYLQESVDRGKSSFAWTSRRINGDLFSVNVLLQAMDSSDSPAIAVYIHDISELKASKQAALEGEAYLKELLESSPIAFMVCDLETGLIRTVNRSGRSMLGLAERAWQNIRAADLLAHPRDRIRFLRQLERQGQTSGEVVLQRPDGERFHAEVTWRYNPGSNDELLFWGFDSTQFKLIAQQLEQSRNEALGAGNAKSEFLSRMSHELRTPMNAILGFGQLLQMNNANLTVEQNDAIGHILSGGAHLLELIDDVLDFSRIGSGHISLRIRRVATAAVLERSLALITPLALQAGVSVDFPAGAIPDVLADPHRMQQVMFNLLSNAIKYNHRGGTVTVTTESPADGKLRIHVRDSGEGIRPRDRPRVFKPFERVSAAALTVRGTGIGLSLCQQLVELMGGSIGFESEPGEGSDFWIDLPAMTEQDASEKRGADGLRILLIENHLASIGPMVEVVRKLEGCELITATNGSDGIDVAKSSLPDLILMDVNLSGSHGTEAVKQFKGDDATRAIPVIGLLPDTKPNRVNTGRPAGFSQLLAKPLSPEVLLAAIAKEALRNPHEVSA